MTTTTFARAKSYLTRRINGWYAKHGTKEGITGHVDGIYTTGIDDQHLAIEYTELREGDDSGFTTLRRIYSYTEYPLPQLFDCWLQRRLAASDSY